MSSKSLVIHGHFYQPPREDPWLDEILPEGSAAPFPHWNDRIAHESYGPLGSAKRLDGDGRIVELLNCYEWMNFNVGPTLLRWMEHARPEIYARVLEGDTRSAARLGHGNAIAQVCHHVILPLAPALDKELEVCWGAADFERRFGRAPEGMWLAEAAVDTASLEVLAAEGLKFTILAPRQAKAVRPLAEADAPWQHVDEGSLDVSRPYLVRLPSGASLAVFFYHGPLSQAVAFERLLTDGEHFWQRVTSDAGNGGLGNGFGGLRALATDGETYGHHFAFGEMALAYLLDQARSGRDGWTLTNFAAHLAANQPELEVQLHEPSSWSCVHGVERWRSDCGCGGGPGIQLAWRGPLRKALEHIRGLVDAAFGARAPRLFRHARQALRAYGRVYAGSLSLAEYEAAHLSPGLSRQERDTAWKLLAMIRWSRAAFASCAWFFEDIARIEPLNALTMALRAADIGRGAGMAELADPLPETLAMLAEAHSNLPDTGNGAELFEREVLPRCESPASLAAQAHLKVWAMGLLGTEGHPAAPEALAHWPGVEVTVRPTPVPERFKISIGWALEPARSDYLLAVASLDVHQPFSWTYRLSAPGSEAGEQTFSATGLAWNKRQALASAWVEHAERRTWQEALVAAGPAVGLFQHWQIAQTTQNAGNCWARLFGALAWRYVTGDKPLSGAEKDLQAFLRQQAKDNPTAPRLAQRVVEHLIELLGGDPPQLDGAAACLERAQAIDLRMDPYPLQQVFWARRSEIGHHRQLARLLGFAEVSA